MDGDDTPVVGRVLVTDDDPVSRLTLVRGVEHEGHAVTSAGTGREALELLRSEAFDALLLDIVMPEMDGFAVLEQMRRDAALAAVPVIVVSALDDLASIVRGIEMGAVDFLLKPVDAVLLRARLRTSLQQKRIRDLEQAYLRQEMTLRQNEKLATLGRLSAGVAHELNNPAAATARASDQLGQLLDRLVDDTMHLLGSELGASALHEVQETVRTAAPVLPGTRLASPPGSPASDVLERADRLDALALWLERSGADDPWELADVLADLDVDITALEQLTQRFRARQVLVALSWVARLEGAQRLVRELHSGAGRISGIVTAMKGYAHTGSTGEQLVDIHAGLEDTLLMLRARLAGIDVRRDYADDLPGVLAAGSQLNQVWTNLIDNAADATNGSGTITLRTRLEGAHVVVEVEDDGHGIPQDLLGCVFDPFVTTKAPGAGTGLGLNITHQIVTETHGGTIDVASRPGRTTFRVRLPVAGRTADDEMKEEQ